MPRYNCTLPLVHELTVKLRDWYFKCGMFSNQESKKGYFRYPVELHKVLAVQKK